MKIALDIDGVLADLMPVLNAFYNRRNGTNFKVDDYLHHDLEKTWGGTKEDSVRAVENFYQSPDFSRTRPMPYAPESVLKLSQRHELFSITSRPESVRKQTEKFMQHYFSGTIKRIFYTGQYSLSASNINKADICLAERADIIIEDCFETAISCAGKGVNTFWLSPKSSRNEQNHLLLPQNLTPVKSWPEILEKLK